MLGPISLLDWYGLSDIYAQNGKDGGLRALLICPDLRLAAELSGLLAAKLPALRLEMLQEYPARSTAAQAAERSLACFLDVTTDAGQAAACMDWMASDFPALPSVALLGSNDPDLILKCLRRGAAEFLIHPFTPDQLERILRKLVRLRRRPRRRTRDAGR